MGRRLLLLCRKAPVAGGSSHATMGRRERGGDRRGKGGSRMSQHWQQGLGIMREGIKNVPVLAAGIGEGEGRDLECPSYVLGWQGKKPFCP